MTFGGWDFRVTVNPEAEFVNAVEVTVRREADSPAGSVPLMLAKIFGATEADARSNGSSVGALRSREMMIVQDVTSSFRDEIDQGRLADLTLELREREWLPWRPSRHGTFVGERKSGPSCSVSRPTTATFAVSGRR